MSRRLDVQAAHSDNAGMKKPPAKQYTIRSIPADVDRDLREQARREGRSLNEVVIENLRRGVGLDGNGRVYDDLDDLFGAMKPDPDLEQRLEEQRRIDPALWR